MKALWTSLVLQEPTRSCTRAASAAMNIGPSEGQSPARASAISGSVRSTEIVPSVLSMGIPENTVFWFIVTAQLPPGRENDLRSQASAPMQWLMTKPVEHLNKAPSINYDISAVIRACVSDLHPRSEVERQPAGFAMHCYDARTVATEQPGSVVSVCSLRESRPSFSAPGASRHRFCFYYAEKRKSRGGPRLFDA